MKIIKKIGILFMSLCLCIPYFSMVAHAEDGRISFTDPQTTVGAMVEVTCAVRSTAGNVGDVEISLTYDSTYLRFDSGDGVTASGDGALTYSGSGSSSELTFTMTFQALQEGTTEIGIASATVSSDGGTTLTMTQGQSRVEIGEGDPSLITEDSAASASSANDIQVDVNGTTYTLTDNFADADIPSGYARTQVELDGQQRQMVTNETSGATLGYLLDSAGTGDFFLYTADNATFSPYEEITISDTTSIIVLSDTSQVNLPSSYQEANLTLNGKDFPVWQDTAREGFYVLYAMNSNGENGYYQYDQGENTYQRFEVTDTADSQQDEQDSSSLLGRLRNFINDHFNLFFIVGGLVGLIVLIILIVIAVKLHNRNAEIDELYDEYGIDMEDEEPAKPAVKEKKSRLARREKEEEDFDDYDDEDFDDEDVDFDEEDFGDEEFEEKKSRKAERRKADVKADEPEEDDFDDEDFDDFDEDDFGEADLDDDLADLDYDDGAGNYEDEMGYTGRGLADELPIDDLDALLGETPKKKKGHVEDDDTFKVDFVDLD